MATKIPSFKKFYLSDRFSKRAEFFFRNAGSTTDPRGRAKNAMMLAEAEAEAEKRGWKTEWADDIESWSDFHSDVRMGHRKESDKPNEILVATLVDERGHTLASLGGNEFGRNAPQNRRYGQVVEAELALEALDQLGWKWVPPKGF